MLQLFGSGTNAMAIYLDHLGSYSPALLRNFASWSISVAAKEARPAVRTDGSAF